MLLAVTDDETDTVRHVGVVVDELHGVRHVPQDARDAPPQGSDRHIASVASLDDGEMLVLIDLQRLITDLYVDAPC